MLLPSAHHPRPHQSRSSSFFFNDTPPTEISTLSLHDALPISAHVAAARALAEGRLDALTANVGRGEDRKSTRLNSSHPSISYAVFCLKKKNKIRSVRYNRRDALRLARVDQACNGHRGGTCSCR